MDFHILLYRAFHAERNYLRPYLNSMGLEVGQPKLVYYLEQNGPCSQRQLAEYFEVDCAAVSRMLDALEKREMVTRRPDGQSRRSNLVELTEKGRQACQAWKAHCREMENIMLRGFNEEEQEQFADFLSRVYQNFGSAKEEEQ